MNIPKEVYNTLTLEELDLLSWIEDRRLTRETLCKLTNMCDRSLRTMISKIKDKGVYIHSSPYEKGYKLGVTEKEKKEVDEQEYNLAMGYLKRISKRGKFNLDQLQFDIKE